jgi:hypothetical protein
VRFAATWFLVIAAASAVRACPVPVFRYGLHYWEADPYEVALIHSGPMSAEEQAAARLLAEYAQGNDTSTNLTRRSANSEPEVGVRALAEAARMIVYAPGSATGGEPVWEAPLTCAAVRQLV